MISKKIIIFFKIVFLFYQCKTVIKSFDKHFAIYETNPCHNQNSKYGCYFERYITADGVIIGVKKEENQPYSNSTKIWKQSIVYFLEESGYEIIDSKSMNNYEYIKSIVRFKEEIFVYGIAFKMDEVNKKEIYIIEFAGPENNYKKYENQINQFIDGYFKKKIVLQFIPILLFNFE